MAVRGTELFHLPLLFGLCPSLEKVKGSRAFAGHAFLHPFARFHSKGVFSAYWGYVTGS